MKLSQLKEIVNALPDYALNYDVVIVAQTFELPKAGPTDATDIEAVHLGFDWNSGMIILYPQIELRAKELK